MRTANMPAHQRRADRPPEGDFRLYGGRRFIGMITPIDARRPVEVVMDQPGTYLHWGVIQISVANLIVIGLMLLVFVLALVLPFPRGRQRP